MVKQNRPRTIGKCAAAAVIGLAVPAGCGDKKRTNDRGRATLPTQYEQLPPAEVPDFMKGTIYEQALLMDTEPAIASGFGLVVNLRGTGDSTAPSAVREYMINQMLKRGLKRPEALLISERVAIVRADGIVPPGIRVGEHFDVQVSALPQSHTASLAGGRLYQTDLAINGANELSPGNPVEVMARTQGEVFVNPAYALLSKNELM